MGWADCFKAPADSLLLAPQDSDKQTRTRHCIQPRRDGRAGETVRILSGTGLIYFRIFSGFWGVVTGGKLSFRECAEGALGDSPGTTVPSLLVLRSALAV